MPSIRYLILLIPTFAFAASWEPVGTKAHPDCVEESPCRIIETNAVFEIVMNIQVKDSMKSMHDIQIKNLKNGSIEKYKTDETNDIGAKEHFELFKIELKGKEVRGLALYAYNSAREGKSYYYFIYDASKQKFVLSDSTFPKLTYDAKAKAFVTPVEGSKYSLDKNYKLNPL